MRTKQTFSFLYLTAKKDSSRIKKNGLSPIYFRLKINDKRAEISTRKHIKPEDWDQLKQKVKGNNEHNKSINFYLTNLKNEIETAYNTLVKTQKNNINPNDILYQVMPGIKKDEYTILQLFEKHNSEMKQLINHTFAKGTYDRYKISYKRLQHFLDTECKGDMHVDLIDNAIAARYNTHIITTYKCTSNTSVKYIKHLKRVLNFGVTMGWLKYNPVNLKVATKTYTRGHLTEMEVEAIKNLPLNEDAVCTIRDVFIFVCHTGLSYSDVKKLTSEHIVIGINGMKSISIDRCKTNEKSIIPILPPAQEILDKYCNYQNTNYNCYLLPVASDQEMNRFLKIISKSCGITKNVSMHLARHTFATTITLSRGVPIETVSKMLGHASIRTTQIYSKIVAAKVFNDMEILSNKYYSTSNQNSPTLAMSK